MSRSTRLRFCVLWAAGAALPPTALAQPSRADAVASARAAQRRFEIERIRWLPATAAWSGERCDERLGRMCLTHDPRDDWWPGPEDVRVRDARERMLDELAAAHAVAPSDPWILGQRVVYLGEAGRWAAADSLARAACERRADPWCHALEGLALHALGRFPDAERAFRAALDGVPGDSAAAWLDPEPLLDGRGRSWLEPLSAGARERAVARVWALADPLLLVAGNDRLTEHLARETVARAREDARNPYGMTWSTDLERLLVRYGWEVGWERVESPYIDPSRAVEVVGHHDPEARPMMPPGAALADPVAAPPPAWLPAARRPREAYAPGYAAVILPADAQIAAFPRGERVAVVAAIELPEDTTFHAGHEHPGRTDPVPPWRGLRAGAGLFLLQADSPDAEPLAVRADGRSATLLLEAPAGRWVASAEVWDPAVRRAGRTRRGVDAPRRSAEAPTLSDLLLAEGVLPEGSSLAEAAARALPRGWVATGGAVGIVWEVFGLPAETVLAYRLSVERRGAGLLRRAARALRLLRSTPAPVLEWQEEIPSGSGPALRGIELQLEGLDPGSWVVRLEIRSDGRDPLVRERAIELRAPPEG